MKNFNLKDMKGNLPHMEKFARRYIVEVLTAVAILIGAFSAWSHLFWGTVGWSMLFAVAGSILGLFWSSSMDKVLKKIYSFSAGSNKAMTLATECIKILIALFIPFVYFGLLGLMAGTAYQYYIHFTRSESKG